MKKILILLKKQVPVFIFFLLFYGTLNILTYLNYISDCFPVTVITVDKEIVDSLLKTENICESNVFSEKMTFDSSIFNHYETPPVKDIFFLTFKIPYNHWENIKNINNATIESNPFTESVVKIFYNSRLKWLSLIFIFIFISGLLMFAASMPKKHESGRIFKLNTTVTLLVFSVCSATVFFKFPSKIMTFAILSLSSVLFVYIMFILLYIKFVLEKKKDSE